MLESREQHRSAGKKIPVFIVVSAKRHVVKKQISFQDDKLIIDNEKCNYCGRCAKSCPVDAWDVNEAFLVSFGGTFGNHISKGREFLPLITSEEQLFRVTDAAIQFFADHANAGERFKFTIDRVGEEKLYEVLKGAYDG